MSFNPIIPQATDIIASSQNDLLTNFTQLNTVFGTDHIAFDAASNNGKHNKATFPFYATLPVNSDPNLVAPGSDNGELVLFSLKQNSNNKTELFLQKEGSATTNQFSKDGQIFIGAHPVFAVNVSDTSPNNNLGAGTYNFTVNSNYNLNTALTRRVTANLCHYFFSFTNAVLDNNGAPTNKYFFSINGFRNSSSPVLGKVPNSATYDAVVKSDSIEVVFVNQNNSTVSNMIGFSVICWRMQ